MLKVVVYKKYYFCNFNKYLSFKYKILNVYNYFNLIIGIC